MQQLICKLDINLPLYGVLVPVQYVPLNEILHNVVFAFYTLWVIKTARSLQQAGILVNEHV